MSLRLYGIVRAGHPLPPGVRAVVGAELAVVVGDLRADGLTDQDAVSHLDILCELVRTGPVLPLRFGTVAPDDDAVRAEVLRDDLAPRLDRLDGLVEIRVGLEFDEQTVMLAVLDAHPGLAAGATDFAGQLELGRRIDEHVTTWRRERAAELLAGVGVDRVELAPAEDGAQNWAVLVASHELSVLERTVGGLAGVTAHLLGPMPAYSFLEEPAPQPTSRWGF
jgi:hypothetical protein